MTSSRRKSLSKGKSPRVRYNHQATPYIRRSRLTPRASGHIVIEPPNDNRLGLAGQADRLPGHVGDLPTRVKCQAQQEPGSTMPTSAVIHLRTAPGESKRRWWPEHRAQAVAGLAIVLTAAGARWIATTRSRELRSVEALLA